MTDTEAIRKSLCAAFCEDVVVSVRGDLLTVSIPMKARDGDGFTAYLSRSNGGWRISDAANTMMRLSYENDLAKLFSGARGKLFNTVMTESGLSDCSSSDRGLPESRTLRFGQPAGSNRPSMTTCAQR
jgi:hypothetical protein